MLKSINEESRISSEWETNLDKITNERGGSTESDAPSTKPVGPSNKSAATKTSFVDSGAGVV